MHRRIAGLPQVWAARFRVWWEVNILRFRDYGRWLGLCGYSVALFVCNGMGEQLS